MLRPQGSYDVEIGAEQKCKCERFGVLAHEKTDARMLIHIAIRWHCEQVNVQNNSKSIYIL